MTIVNHPTFGTGTIISQDGNNITVDFSGTIKTLVGRYANLSYEDGTPVYQAAPVLKNKNRGESKRQRDAQELAAFAALSNLDKLKNAILHINSLAQGDRNSIGYKLISERLNTICEIAKSQGNAFIVEVINSVDKFMKASEKQAYTIARFADENGITY